MDIEKPGYKKIEVQKLERKEQMQGEVIEEETLIDRLNVTTNERGKIVQGK